MEDNKELNNKDLKDVAGGSNLDKYIKILPDKDKKLVDYGTGVALDLEPSIKYEEDGNIEIILRDGVDPEGDAELKL